MKTFCKHCIVMSIFINVKLEIETKIVQERRESLKTEYTTESVL